MATDDSRARSGADRPRSLALGRDENAQLSAMFPVSGRMPSCES